MKKLDPIGISLLTQRVRKLLADCVQFRADGGASATDPILGPVAETYLAELCDVVAELSSSEMVGSKREGWNDGPYYAKYRWWVVTKWIPELERRLDAAQEAMRYILTNACDEIEPHALAWHRLDNIKAICRAFLNRDYLPEKRRDDGTP